MQDLFAELLWRRPEVDEAADSLRRTMPGFIETEKKYQTLAEQILTAAGFELYDQYVTQLLRYSQYEICAYYALGLGLRREIVQSLGV